ncbi:ATP-binding protein [Pseudooceanicola nanhaiensis]|uniref:ATP-binding protein n=1 Tax=Pseudooceanicola nanhaiensis TaxID=375761 RepID=UPI001CD68285|nr:sensor histidine kinase [Pseudooceanicola nanhaiensis]MCA0922077.1 HAMP domain-containing protein [Pseudooceanicola nanhaiensis]
MSLTARIQIIAVASVLATAILVLLFGTYRTDQRLQESITASLASRVATHADQLQAGVTAHLNQLQELLHGPAVAEFLVGGDLDPLTLRLHALVAAHPDLLQARYIDRQGHEKIRIDRRPEGVRIRTRDELQDKSARTYVTQMLLLGPGQTYVSPLNLNREGGMIEVPHVSTLRLAAPLFDADGSRRGGIVLNLHGRALLPPAQLGNVSLRLVDQTGGYLLHPDGAWLHGQELGNGHDFMSEFGIPLPALPAEDDIRVLTLDAGGVHYDAAAGWVTVAQGQSPRHWLLIATLPAQVRRTLASADLVQSGLVTAVIALLATAGAWVLIHGTTRRLVDLSEVAGRLSAGERNVAIAVQGRDEVGRLARALNQMTAQLQLTLSRETRAKNLLQITNAELKRANGELEDFARAAAHDLKTPLRALCVLPSWIEEDLSPVPPPLSEHLSEMKAQTARLEALVDGLLTYALIGREAAGATRFDPAPVIEQIVASLSPPPGFDVVTGPLPAQVTFVRTEFEIILRNLVGNALCHHDRASGRIHIRLAQAEDHTVLEVEDDGPGIPEADRDRLRLPLRTGKTRDEGGGTGLGLAFITKIADRWGGCLDIEDAPGRGCLFRLTLPADMARPPARDDPETGLAA